MRTFSLTTRLAAPAERVWERAVTLAGVNAVLRPILRMTAPPGLRDATIADLRPGEPAGRSWLLLGGLAERTVEPLTAGTLSLPDALGSSCARRCGTSPDRPRRPRASWPSCFRHRHRRLVALHGAALEG